jgi:hypothetical protein
LSVSYLSFHFHLICWLYYICHSTSMWYVDCIISVIPLPSDMLNVSYLTDIIQSTYQMEVEWHMIQSTYLMEEEWQIWYSQHIRWKWNERYNDMLSVSYLSFHFHLICWMYHICHSTSIWYVDCIVSVIPLPSMEVEWHMIQWTYQMEVEWQIWYIQHIRWKWNDIW